MGNKLIWVKAEDNLGNTRIENINIVIKHSLTNAEVILNPTSFEYDETAKEPEVTVKLTIGGNVETLQEGIDYDLSYINNVNIGVGTVVITGKGQYKGEKEELFSIVDTTKPEAPIINAKMKNSLGEQYIQGTITNKNVWIELTSEDADIVASYEW